MAALNSRYEIKSYHCKDLLVGFFIYQNKNIIKISNGTLRDKEGYFYTLPEEKIIDAFDQLNKDKINPNNEYFLFIVKNKNKDDLFFKFDDNKNGSNIKPIIIKNIYSCFGKSFFKELDSRPTKNELKEKNKSLFANDSKSLKSISHLDAYKHYIKVEKSKMNFIHRFIFDIKRMYKNLSYKLFNKKLDERSFEDYNEE